MSEPDPENPKRPPASAPTAPDDAGRPGAEDQDAPPADLFEPHPEREPVRISRIRVRGGTVTVALTLAGRPARLLFREGDASVILGTLCDNPGRLGTALVEALFLGNVPRVTTPSTTSGARRSATWRRPG